MSDYVEELDPEVEVVCPYENAHMVRRKRMQYHLMKCRKNHPGKEFATCPFNACHEMPRPELRYHIAMCPDKAMIEKDLAYAQDIQNGEVGTFKGCTDVPAYNMYEVTVTESWDDEANPHPRIGVDPALLNKVKFKNITGMTASEKREFHRYLTPEEDESPAIPSESRPDKENERPKPTDGKLRLPKNAPKAFSMYKSPAPLQTPSTVFAYSLAQAGIGRGRGVGALSTAQPGLAQPGLAQPGLAQPAMGRGVPRNAHLHAPSSSAYQLDFQRPEHPYIQPPEQRHVPDARATDLSAKLKAYQIPDKSAPSDPLQRPPTRTAAVPEEVSPRYEAIPPQPAQSRSRPVPSKAVPNNVFWDGVNLKPIGRGQRIQAGETIKFPGDGPDKAGQFTDWWSDDNGRISNAGIGRGSPQSTNPAFIVPNVAPKKQHSMSMIAKDWIGSDGSSGSGYEDSSSCVNASHGIEDAKKSKQIHKKLRQIEALEAMLNSGQQLNTEEAVKLSKKDEFLAELAALRQIMKNTAMCVNNCQKLTDISIKPLKLNVDE